MTSKVGLCLKLFIAGLAGVLSINVSLAQKVPAQPTLTARKALIIQAGWI